MIEIFDCPDKENCPYLHPEDRGWCNKLPVWYESADRSVVKCTKQLADEKNVEGFPLYRCERVFPTRPCKYKRILMGRTECPKCHIVVYPKARYGRPNTAVDGTVSQELFWDCPECGEKQIWKPGD